MLTPFGVGVSKFVWVLGRPFLTIDSTHAFLFYNLLYIMGYNGGVNKRGYYRRNNGMYSKSASKRGSKIMDNTLIAGLGLFSLLGGALIEAANNYVPQLKPLNIKANRFKFFICSIIALLCPIAGWYLCVFEYWWVSGSILLFGTIEFFAFAFINAFPFELEKEYYFEKFQFNKQIKHSRKILLGGLIVNSLLAVLNTYAIYLLFDIYLRNDGSIAFVLAFIKITINVLYAYEFYKSLKNFEDIRKKKWDQIR